MQKGVQSVNSKVYEIQWLVRVYIVDLASRGLLLKVSFHCTLFTSEETTEVVDMAWL